MTNDQQSIFVQLALKLEWHYVLLALIISIPAWCIYNIFFHPLSKYPGPLIAKLGIPIIEGEGGSIWQFWQTYTYQYVWKLEELHDKYGEIVRIGRTHLSFSSSIACSQIYSYGQSFQFPKTDFYKSFQVYKKNPSLFSETHSENHSNFRRSISSAYSMNNLIKLEEYVEPLIELYTKRLQKEINDGGDGQAHLDLAKWNHFFAMDAVGELAFGQSFGLTEKGKDEEKFLIGVSNLSHWGSMAGWLPTFSQPIRSLLKIKSRQPDGPKTVKKVTEPLINERYRLLILQSMSLTKEGEEKLTKKDLEQLSELEQRQDMLSNFCKSKNPTTGKLLERNEVLRTAISVISAGSDTSATALTTMIGYLVRNPKIYKELQDEIDQAFENGLLNWPIKYSQSCKLELLQACIKETLRIHPPISMSLPRQISTKEGVIIKSGKGLDQQQCFVPFGCQVSCSPFVLHRNPEEFGKTSRTFNPYRWMGDQTEDERKELEKKLFMFGGGARQCIGKNISLMEINKTLPTLLRLFDFSTNSDDLPGWTGKDSDGSIGSNIPWKCRSTWFLEVETFPVRISKRSNVDID